MRTNPKIREVFEEISARSIELSNNYDEQRKYLRRLIEIFRNDLNDHERIYVFKQLLEEISFKTVVSHPDKVREIYSIRTKFMFQTLVGASLVVLLAGAVFRTNPYINNILDSIGKTFMLFGK